MHVSLVCTSCGKSIPVVGDPSAPMACPHCSAVNAKSDDGAITATPPDPNASTEYDDRPYEMDGDDVPPTSGADVPSIDLKDAIVPAKYEWDGSPKLTTRLKVFIAYAIGLLPVGGLLVSQGTWSLLDAAIGIPIVTVLAAFVLGTFDRVVLTRNYKGRVTLAKSWRVCFYELKPWKITRKDYERVATTSTSDHGLADWLVLLWLLGSGCLPGILWFFMVHIKPVHQVALTKDHGRADLVLYQGRDEEYAKEIAKTVAEVCKYRWQKTY